MKRKAAIGFAAFYLLLSTGMYVCIVSCGSNWVIDLLTSVPSSLNGSDQHTKTDDTESQPKCNGGEDCPCCKKHGTYTVTENIKPIADDQLNSLKFLNAILNYSNFQLKDQHLRDKVVPAKTNAPPPGDAIPIFISLHSFLI
ncbi:MAG: hypothetical protein V4708_11360 [Bacteroidota bacterium]